MGDVNGLGFALSVIGILLMVALCKHIPSSGLIRYMGRHTLPLYFLSGGVPNVLAIISVKMGIVTNLITYLVLCVLSIIIALIGTIVIERYIPFLLDLRLLHNSRRS